MFSTSEIKLLKFNPSLIHISIYKGYPEEGVRRIQAVCFEQDGTWKATAHNIKRSMICEFIGMCTYQIKLRLATIFVILSNLNIKIS